uniref:Uncharacterized protein n=1 Tax=Sinocyclocheilus rhinocerous TaxID=307959 RepID=A0A673HSU0_9TELE
MISVFQKCERAMRQMPVEMASLKCQPSSINQSSARNNNGCGDDVAFMGVALTQEEKARLGVCRRNSHAGRAQEAEKESERHRGDHA